MEELFNSPYGQLVVALFKGKENRANIDAHASSYHKQMWHMVEHGISVKLPSGIIERFNVICILCCDLLYLKDILGKCSTSGDYGCYYCKKRGQYQQKGRMAIGYWNDKCRRERD